MKLIYISSDNRSGSTLLDMMLSGHSDIVSVGEAHHLQAYATGDRDAYRAVHDLRCFCGKEVGDCHFWQSIARQLSQPLEALELKPFFLRSDFRGRPFLALAKKLCWWSLQVAPWLYGKEVVHRWTHGDVVARDSLELYRAIGNVTGNDYVLDSSKSPFRLRDLADLPPKSVKVILLCRDFRGVVTSKMKRGVPLVKAALHWRWCAAQMDYFSRRLAEESIIRVRYEDLCRDPAAEMGRILEFLSLDFKNSVIMRNTDGLHHIGGSPSKFGHSSVLRLDQSYLTALGKWQVRLARLIAGKYAVSWRYDDRQGDT